ncbi:MAG: hypothetical protein QXP53_01920 [Candidatus Pacearchaeota archaeon]
MKITFIEKTAITVIFFVALLFVFPKNLFIGDISNLFTAVSLLFGILAGFFIAATLSNYFRLQSLVAEETTQLGTIYVKAVLLEPKIKKELEDAIDSYARAEFDYELHEYIDNTWREFENIVKATEKIKKRETSLFTNFIDSIARLSTIRQEISLTARKILGLGHWIVLIILAAMVIFLSYIMKTPTVTSSIFTVLISAATCLVLFLLYEIDSNFFAEERLAFTSFERVFHDIGKLPYYPEESIKKGRIKLKGKYRIGILESKKPIKRRIEIREF